MKQGKCPECTKDIIVKDRLPPDVFEVPEQTAWSQIRGEYKVENHLIHRKCYSTNALKRAFGRG